VAYFSFGSLLSSFFQGGVREAGGGHVRAKENEQIATQESNNNSKAHAARVRQQRKISK